jgi:hypothetical protein
MHLIPDIAVFQERLDALPLATYKIGETVRKFLAVPCSIAL